jgi:glutamate decarboxylase
MPVVAIRLKDNGPDALPCTLEDIARHLQAKGWFVPVYHLPPDNERIEVMRIVVRADFNHTLTQALLCDLEATIQQFSIRQVQR